jgi:hypothetical protein
MMGGYAGGQAQFARVPFANVGPLNCKKKIWSACDNSNPNAHLMEACQRLTKPISISWSCREQA